MLNALVIDPKDNVANLIGPGEQGSEVNCRIEGSDRPTAVTLADTIPPNHKFAFTAISAGEPIIKYGLVIGKASTDIAQGAHVHVHNIESNRGRGDLG